MIDWHKTDRTAKGWVFELREGVGDFVLGRIEPEVSGWKVYVGGEFIRKASSKKQARDIILDKCGRQDVSGHCEWGEDKRCGNRGKHLYGGRRLCTLHHHKATENDPGALQRGDTFRLGELMALCRMEEAEFAGILHCPERRVRQFVGMPETVLQDELAATANVLVELVSTFRVIREQHHLPYGFDAWLRYPMRRYEGKSPKDMLDGGHGAIVLQALRAVLDGV